MREILSLVGRLWPLGDGVEGKADYRAAIGKTYARLEQEPQADAGANKAIKTLGCDGMMERALV